MRFITKFSGQQQQLRNILSDHWHLLYHDPTLRKYIRDHPEITFRCATPLRDRPLCSHHTPALRREAHARAIYKCGHCNFCPWISTGSHFVLPNGETFYPKCVPDCNTQGVIYLMCKCQAFYVRKAICQFKQRLNDHIYYSANGKMFTPVSRHLDLYHKFDTSFVTFLVQEVVSQDPRGGNWDRRILQRETLWIESLNATYLPGINEVQSYKSFQ